MNRKSDYMLYIGTINIIILLLVIYLVFKDNLKELKRVKSLKKEVELVTTLTEKKKRDDIDLEKDKDLVLIDKYMEYVSEVINRYNKSRSKIVAQKTKQELLGKTIEIIPTFSKYVNLEFYYDPSDELFKGMNVRDLMMVLESSYKDYTHDNLECFNTILTVAQKLRDL